MKSLEEKRDEPASEYAPIDPSNGHESCLEQAGFTAGWNACAKDYESRIYDLEKKLKIATKVLTEQCCIDDCGFDVENEDIEILRNCMKAIDSEARKALKELEKDSEELAEQEKRR